MVKRDNFCKFELITLKLKLFDGKNAKLLILKLERQTNLSIWMFNVIIVLMGKEIVSDLVAPISTFGFGNRICEHMFVLS